MLQVLRWETVLNARVRDSGKDGPWPQRMARTLGKDKNILN